MPRYIALNIGPIFKTINNAQRTRMSWAGSYFFSYLIRELAFIYLPDSLGKDFEERLIIPNKSIKAGSTHGAGVYPDRILFESNKGDFDKVQEAITALINNAATEITKHIHDTIWNSQKNGKRKVTESEVSIFLENYLQFYFIEKELEDTSENTEINILSEMYRPLDLLELRNQQITDGTQDYLFHFLFRVNKNQKGKKSFLVNDAFNGAKKFDSLIEISTRGLSRVSMLKEQYQPLLEGLKIETKDIKDRSKDLNKPYSCLASHHIWQHQVKEDLAASRANEDEDSEESQEGFLKSLKTVYPAHFRNYHKYIAVVKADGDNIGKSLAKIGADKRLLQKFSADLIDFSKEAAELIHSYGAAPIYIGGDDLFIFAPLASLDEKGESIESLFSMIEKVDKLFNTYMKHYPGSVRDANGQMQSKFPTLSWGVASAYYKHPLIDTIQKADQMLAQAKRIDLFPEKNTIGFSLQKHSSQTFDMFLEKRHKDAYIHAQRLLRDLLNGKDENPEKLISGIAQRLKEPAFDHLLSEAVSNGTLPHFFSNTFNEAIHKRPDVKPYMERVEQFIQQVYTAYDTKRSEEVNQSPAGSLVYTLLRLVHFLLSKEENE